MKQKFFIVLLSLMPLFLLGIHTYIPSWSALLITLGLFSILFIPGFILSKALFANTFDHLQNLSISISLSLALVVLQGVLLANTLGITLVSLLVSMFCSNMLLLIFYLLRESPQADTLTSPASFWLPFSAALRSHASVIASILLLLLIVVVSYALRPSEQFTALYILGSEGRLEQYPLTVEPGEALSLFVGVDNQEGRATNYKLELLPGNVTKTFSLTHNRTWRDELTFTAPLKRGTYQINVHLYKDDSTHIYRYLRLLIDVQP